MAGSKKVELLNLITEQNVQILKNQDDIEGLLTLNDGPSIDAFGRSRTSSPETIFESKQIFDNQPLFWDDQEVSGGGTSVGFSTRAVVCKESDGTTHKVTMPASTNNSLLFKLRESNGSSTQDLEIDMAESNL